MPNPKSKSKKPAKKTNLNNVKWLIITGGSDEERREEAGKRTHNHYIEYEKKYNLTEEQMMVRSTSNHKTEFDVKGYDKDALIKLLFGTNDYVDILSDMNQLMSGRSKGVLANLYGLNGLILHNLNDKHVDVMALIMDYLYMLRRIANRNINTPYGMFIITISTKTALKKFGQEFTGLFEVIPLGKNAGVKLGGKKKHYIEPKIMNEMMKEITKAYSPENKKHTILFLAMKLDAEIKRKNKVWDDAKAKGIEPEGERLREYKTTDKNGHRTFRTLEGKINEYIKRKGLKERK